MSNEFKAKTMFAVTLAMIGWLLWVNAGQSVKDYMYAHEPIKLTHPSEPNRIAQEMYVEQ